MIYKMYNWWEEQKRCETTLYWMIGTFFILLCIGICFGFMVIPVVLTVVFNHWLWLLLWLIILPLCVGVFNELFKFLM